MAAQTDAPGWFGKLSMLGDFASRRLSSDWIRPCDEWLSASLRTSQERLGERWLATYLATPVWWGHLARAGLDTLADGASLDVFEQALLDAPPWPTATGPAWSRPLSANGRERHAVADGAGLNHLAQDLAAEGLRQRLAGKSFWWPLRGEPGSGSCTLAAGLPSATAFADLLTGDW